MKSIATLVFYALLFIPASGFSQGYMSGYIVKANGDTVHGLVKHPFGNAYGVKFKDSGAIRDVKAFYIEGGGIFRLITLAKDGRPHMVRVLTDGYLNYYEVQLGVTTDSYYHILEKQDGSQECYSSDFFSGFKATVLRFLADDTALCEKIKEGKLGKKDILQIVDEYNSYKKAP